MSECILWQGPVLTTTRQQGVVPPQEQEGVITRWQVVLPQGLGVATMRQQRIVLPQGQEEEAGMWPQKVAPFCAAISSLSPFCLLVSLPLALSMG